MTPKLKPTLSILDTALITIGMVVGSAIYQTPKLVAGQVIGEVEYMLYWLIGGVICILGTLLFAKLGSIVNSHGGFYKLFTIAFNKDFAFVINWSLLIVNAIVSISVIMVGVNLLSNLLPEYNYILSEPYPKKIAIAFIVTFLLIINLLGLRITFNLERIIVLIKTVLLIFICFWGIYKINYKNNSEIVSDLHNYNLSDFAEHFDLLILVPILHAFNGYHNVINFGSDIKNNKRNIFISLLGSMLLIFIVYLLINFIYISHIGLVGLKHGDIPIKTLCTTLFGNWGASFISAIIILTIIGYVNISYTNNARICIAMAEDGVLPKKFMEITHSRQTQPLSTIVFYTLMLIVVVLFTEYKVAIDIIILMRSLSLLIAIVALFKLMKTNSMLLKENKLIIVASLLFVLMMLAIIWSVATLNIYYLITIPLVILFGWLMLFLFIKKLKNKAGSV